MDVATLEASLKQAIPPPGLPRTVEALWYERRGDWDRAHKIAQDIDDSSGAWVHAYLHRREGDESNAAYWYDRAAQPIARGSLDDEWRVIASALLGDSP